MDLARLCFKEFVSTLVHLLFREFARTLVHALMGFSVFTWSLVVALLQLSFCMDFAEAIHTQGTKL